MKEGMMNLKDKIICLVGASGSGKTTISKELEIRGYNIIHSYTNREQRENNEWGHKFISKDIAEEARKCGKYLDSNIVAFKEVYAGLYYFAIKEQYQNKGNSIYVVCPHGASQLKEEIEDAEVIIIFLIADESVRFERLEKERGLENSINRIESDKEMLRFSKCDYIVDANREIKEVLKDIEKIIETN